MPHVPDTVPGKRVTGAGARTEGREASRQTSEVGAVCRKAARTDLCGGRPVMGVPTAIARLAMGSEASALSPSPLEVPSKGSHHGKGRTLLRPGTESSKSISLHQ